MVGPNYQQWFITAVLALFVLRWLLTPWLGFMAFLYVPMFVFFVSAGLVAVTTIEGWLRELREGRHSRDGGVR